MGPYPPAACMTPFAGGGVPPAAVPEAVPAVPLAVPAAVPLAAVRTVPPYTWTNPIEPFRFQLLPPQHPLLGCF